MSNIGPFLQRYFFYWCICVGTVAMSLAYLMMGGLTASIVYGTEITEETIAFSGWFILLAPAFLTFIDQS